LRSNIGSGYKSFINKEAGMKKLLHIFTAVVLLVSFSNTSSHTMDGDSLKMMMKPTHEFGYISPGMSWINSGNLNGYLMSLGYSRFQEQAWTLSLGKYRDWNRLVMEHHILARILGDNLNGTLRSSLGYGEIIFDGGFNVLPPEMSLDLYPYLGIGAGLAWMNFRNNTKTLPQLLLSTEPNSFLMQATPLFDLGIGSNYLLGHKDGTMGLAIGLRIGYLVDLNAGKRWYSDMTAVSGLPSIMQNGAYIRLILGGWGKHHHMMMEGHEK
jgi:hypothetical protein